MLTLYQSVNRDEAVFAEPDRFDVTRSPNPHLAFGIGPHFCLGGNQARLELKVMVQELIAPGTTPRRAASTLVAGIEHLPVVLERAA